MRGARYRLVSVLVASALIFAAAMGSSAAPERTFLQFGGSSPGGVFYYVFGVLTTLLTEKMPNVIATNVATGASVDNLKRLMKGELDFGISHASNVWESLNGEGPFGGQKATQLRAIGKVYNSPHYFVTLKKTGIKTMSDLAGKKVAIGTAGSGAAYNSLLTFEALGIKADTRYMSFADAGRDVKEGRIHALGQSGAPSGAVTELAETADIYVIPMTDEEIAKIVASQRAPYFWKGYMSPATYKGMTEPVPTFFVSILWYAHERVPADTVYQVLKTMYEPANRKRLEDGYPLWKEIDPDLDELKRLGIPLHPGAEKFYREMGIPIP
ncbi:MAG: TAXI family TRAP transporter solute-binding subunit [Firmicutes bacterium]|jgi:TRAP transporter TAXI family solute receptor|nr:TAXI family TRAP transporter solute-binding subunit [Bacillota bacterium]